MAGAKLKGMDQLLRELEGRFGKKKMESVIDKALLSGAEIIAKCVKQQLEPSRDTGKTIDEVTIMKPQWIKDKRTVKIAWEGPGNRYMVIHLVDGGHIDKHTGKFVKPKAMGALNRAIRQGQKRYFSVLESELRRL